MAYLSCFVEFVIYELILLFSFFVSVEKCLHKNLNRQSENFNRHTLAMFTIETDRVLFPRSIFGDAGEFAKNYLTSSYVCMSVVLIC